MGKFRDFINIKFIESNPAMVEALLYENRTYGRRSSVFSRAALDLQLYVKYVLLRRNLLEEQEKNRNRAVYPESRINQKLELETIIKKLDQNDIAVFDMWGVLFYEVLNKQQLAALTEAGLHYIGLSDMENAKRSLSPGQMQRVEDIRLDFIVKNDRMNDLLMEASRHGKKIYVYNNSDQSDQFAQRVLERHSCCAELTSFLEGRLHITNKITNITDVLYKDVSAQGERYRPFYHINAVTALYNQIVNIKFHSQDREYPLFYEYGFAYGGILTCGFCQYLNHLADENSIDLFLFVARDGFIFKKIYDAYYKKVGTSYIKYSRFASYELIFEDFPEEYVDKNIKSRMYRQKCDNSLRKILQECNLGFLESCVTNEGLELEQKLNDHTYLIFRKIILRHKAEICESFRDSCEAAKRYFMSEVMGYKKVCVVDLGWHGKSIIYLKHLLEKRYGWDGTVIGAVVGAAGDGVTQVYVRQGIINAYAFKDDFWRHTGSRNGSFMGEDEIMCIEALFSSEEDTLLRYVTEQDGRTGFIYGRKNRNAAGVRMIHKGIMDFAEKFSPIVDKFGLQVMPRDAYTPIDCFLQNKRNREIILKSYDEAPGAINGFVGEDETGE